MGNVSSRVVIGGRDGYLKAAVSSWFGGGIVVASFRSIDWPVSGACGVDNLNRLGVNGGVGSGL